MFILKHSKKAFGNKWAEVKGSRFKTFDAALSRAVIDMSILFTNFQVRLTKEFRDGSAKTWIVKASEDAIITIDCVLE